MRKEPGSPESQPTGRALAWAPASLSNLGPGFDCLGIALTGWGDRIEAKSNDLGSLRIQYHKNSLWSGSYSTSENTAGVAAAFVLEMLDFPFGIDLTIEKGIIPGSGIGSSAASAAGAAWAVNLLMGSPLSKSELVPAVLAGEAVASGSPHGDNVIPALFGGLAVVSAEHPDDYAIIPITNRPHFSVILPKIQILTKHARGILPKTVSLRDAVSNASDLAFLVNACRDGDWREVGKRIMTDRIVEPKRAQLLPPYHAIQQSALKAGAFGCALSGSGPAMFAITGSESEAAGILQSMISAAENLGFNATGIVSTIDEEGTRSIELPELE